MKRWKENEVSPTSLVRTLIQRPDTNPGNMKRSFQMSWSQRGHDIYIIFTRASPSLDFSNFDVALTDRSCTVKASEAEKHGWNFFLEVKAKEAQRIQNNDRLIIVVPKKDPTLFWLDIKKATDSTELSDVIKHIPSDEPPPEKIRHQSREIATTIKTNLPSHMVTESKEDVAETDDAIEPAAKTSPSKEPNHDTLYHHLSSVKSNWHELGSEVVVFTIYVPHLDPWGTNVSFAEERIQISFKTADDKFHKEYSTSPEVVFVWNVKLNKQIVPTKCTHKVTLKLMEIRLYKKEPVKWDHLILPADDPDEKKESDDSSNDDHLSSGDNGTATEEGSVRLPSLDNVGNSCFMNSVLQALANTRELRDFFLEKSYEKDINRTNPLGLGGKMAEEVAEIMHKLWCDTSHSFAPLKFRRLVGEKEQRFVDYSQHDAQEFMACLLDKLHEDLNRVQDKPCYEMPEVGDRNDQLVAQESWKLHTSRNDSFIVDLFHGMFKSKLYCPECTNNSVKFDPFLFLSVPLPKATRQFRVLFFPKDFNKSPVKVSVFISKNVGKAVEVFNQISSLFQCPVDSLRMFEVYKNRIHRFFVPDSSLDKVLSNDIIFVIETLSCKEAKEPVFEIAVLQQRTFPDMPPMCSYCKSSSSDVKIKRCTKCLRIGYCNQECQKADWPQHRSVCERTSDMVGYPFIASVPQSRAKFAHVKRLLWQQATKWTNVNCYDSENKETRTNIDSLFHIVAVNWNGSYKDDLPNLQNFDDELLDLSEYKLLSVTWETDTRLPCFVRVSTKPLECDVCERPPSNSFDLYDCLRLFTAPEVLAPQEAWYCPVCKEHREATKEMSLWQLPDVLIVQLKRFSFKNYLWRDKVDLLVDFPVNGLDMTQYCVKHPEEGPLIYDLFAVVNHYGGIYGGHYTTFVRLPSLDDTTKSTVGWRVCDDNQVMKISHDHVVTKNAYVMFYRKRTVTSPPSNQIIPGHLADVVEEDPNPPHDIDSEPTTSGKSSSGFESFKEKTDETNPDCDGLDEKIAQKIRLSQSDCCLVTTTHDCDDGCKAGGPVPNKPILSLPPNRSSQDMSVGCVVEEPLLKYDEIFPTISSCDDDEPSTGSSLTKDAGLNVLLESLTDGDPPYTDMDAVD